METIVKSLSDLSSKAWKSSSDDIAYKQVFRTYQGGYSFNFPFALSGFTDFKTKEYSNFYLSVDQTLDNFLDINFDTFENRKMLTYLKFGDSYLRRSDIFSKTITYVTQNFTDTLDDNCYFLLEFADNQTCTISFDYNGRKYYLVSDINKNLFFIWDIFLNDNNADIQPQTFTFVFDNSNNYVIFIKPTIDGNESLTKNNNTLVLKSIKDTNKSVLINNKFTTVRSKTYNLDLNLNTSFITYQNNTNAINYDKSDFNLTNNYLFHSPYTSQYKEFLVLKNQLTVDDVFTTGQNMISSRGTNAVQEFRDYSAISNPIDSENSSELALSYVFYNKPYNITTGSNTFISPSSMYPFTALNVNDTKFIKSGSFSFPIPEYADKIFEIERNDYSDDGKVFLCTWLSGSPSGNNKVWIDRYYYPDFISKHEALRTKGVFDVTYDQILENLIATNSVLSGSIVANKIFDKKSDLTFVPNTKYIYSRFENTLTYNNLITCNNLSYNYQDNINATAKMTFSFYFSGNKDSWIVKSLRNSVDGGITVTKTSTTVTFELKLFDNSTNNVLKFSKTLEFKYLKDNFICISYDALTGKGFFFMNNEVIYEFNTPIGQFANKTILYGRFDYNDQDILLPTRNISNIILLDDVIDKDLMFALPIIQGKQKINDLVLTLPCGMRNSIDDVSYLQSFCKKNTNKSNYINISIDNLGISNPNILNSLKNAIEDKVKNHIPATTTINKIEFTNYI
jgi:hypothetical protein